ncbi:TSUP family transporter [Sagittula salina]|uniref:Probable membrane transporter protein n=1 Tax=Sagittula salina TaxID=2820268 RepID=A0A940S5F6_9RHOB|nr:TSUP family transporter [Sagittula salina]MBP0484940.1 TSUP family transporter [Sagittula salina]
MAVTVLSFFALLVVSTSFIAGVFGMAGGMILMGGLLMLLPVAGAMMLHGITQLASNGWRAVLWREHAERRIVLRYSLGLLAAAGLFSLISFVPDQRLVYILLGLAPVVPLLMPDRFVPRATARGGAECCGFICTAMQLVSGVSGPMLDVYFVHTDIGRRAIVATKACCQVLTHTTKIVYFGMLASVSAHETDGLTIPVVAIALAAAVLGTTLARPVLDRLSDKRFRDYTRYILLSIGLIYLARGISGYL